MESIEDNVYQDLLPMYAKEIAKSLVYTKDEKRAEILNNATTSGETGPDGKVYWQLTIRSKQVEQAPIS